MRVADRTEWRGAGARRPRSWRLALWVALSTLLHVPLTPLAALLGLALLFGADDTPTDPVPPITEIPIDLLTDTESFAPPAPSPPPEPAAEPAALAAAPAEKDPEAAKQRLAERDAGALEDAGLDAGIVDAGIADAGPLADAALPEAGVSAEDAGAPQPTPLAVQGARGVVDPNANVKVLLDTERLRSHPLGPRLGTLLKAVYQWRDFFGPTGLDPIRDIDRIYIVGPQLRDSSAVVALLQHRLGQARLQAAIDGLVQRDGEGEWLDAGVPAARARADRAERFFVLPNERLVVVTPRSALESALRMKRATLPRGPAPEVVTAHVETPWRVFIGVPVRIPKSLRWAKLSVLPQTDGGATVRIIAEDEDAETAQSNALELERAVGEGLELVKIGTDPLAELGARFFGGKTAPIYQSLEFRADGTRVTGTVTFTERHVNELLALASRMLTPAPRRPAGTATARGTPEQPPAPPSPAP